MGLGSGAAGLGGAVAAGSFGGPLGIGLSLGASLLGGLFSKKNKQTQVSTPTLDPQFSGLQSMLMNRIQQRLSNPGGLPAGYEASGISDINNTYGLIGQHSANDLTARGLGSSPIAGVVEGNNQLARGGAITKFQQSLPLIARDFENQDLGLAGSLLAQGRGTSSTGTTTTGGGIGGGFTDLGSMLGYLIGKGAFGKKGGG